MLYGWKVHACQYALYFRWNRDRKKSELAADRKSLRRHSANLSQLTEQSILENVQAEKEEEAVKSLPSTPINSKQPTEQDVAQDVTQMNKRNRSRREQLQKQHLNMQQSKTPVNELVANKAEENRKLLSQQSQQRTDPTTSPKPWQMKKLVILLLLVISGKAACVNLMCIDQFAVIQ